SHNIGVAIVTVFEENLVDIIEDEQLNMFSTEKASLKETLKGNVQHQVDIIRIKFLLPFCRAPGKLSIQFRIFNRILLNAKIGMGTKDRRIKVNRIIRFSEKKDLAGSRRRKLLAVTGSPRSRRSLGGKILDQHYSDEVLSITWAKKDDSVTRFAGFV